MTAVERVTTNNVLVSDMDAAELFPMMQGKGRWIDPRTGLLRIVKGRKYPRIHAVVNHGRWVVECPVCASAQIGEPTDQRFYCGQCGNGWFKVVYPDNFMEIEAVLAKVALPENTNWLPGESVQDLIDQIEMFQGHYV